MTLAKRSGAHPSGIDRRTIGLVVLLVQLAAGAALAAPPALSVSASAGAAPACDEAQVTVGIEGIGDPVTQRRPLDVMVVFDRSGSMDDAGWNPPQPVTDAKNGAKLLIDSLSLADDRAGLTSFNDNATLHRALTSNFSSVKSAIDALTVNDATNMARGIRTGQTELNTNGRSTPAVRVMVLLSDGVPTRRLNGSSCANTPSAPNSCTQDAIDQAALAKAAGTVIFTIGLNLTNLPSATEAVARGTLQAIASSPGAYFESPTSAELAGIFAQIGTIVTTLAGSDIVLTHALPDGVSYVSGSATPAPTTVNGQTLVWQLGLLNIGNSTSVTFRVRVSPPEPNQSVVASPASRVEYVDYQGTPAAAAVPAASVSVQPCATPTPSRTATPTLTHTPGPTNTPTRTATPTLTSTPAATATATHTPAPFCGDGTLDPEEICDDGNAIDGDGCESDCTVSTACTLIYPGAERFVGACGAPSHAGIQEAIDAAADGETITICPGVYTEPVLVTRQVRLRAAEPGTAVVQTVGTAFDIRRSGVAIEELTITASGGTAVSADALCPLGQMTCASPGHGSNLRIANNTIINSALGVGWQRRVDCAEISGNVLAANAAHIAILQQEGAPAILVSVTGNQISTGGQSGAAVSLAGIGATIAANTIVASGGAGLVLTAMTDGSQVLENAIASSGGDGITMRPGTTGVRVRDNNITDNAVGLGNESGGTIDAAENWWDSQSGPSGVSWPNPEPGPALTGSGDLIVNRTGGSTTFVEFLCKPFPQGFPSVLGLCGTEVAELRQLVPGRAPDLDPFGRYIVFESSADMNVDGRTAYRNDDGSLEIFLLNRRPKKSLTGVCLGGLLPCDFRNLAACTPCNGKSQCPGDPSADPIVLNGECVVVTQLTDGSGESASRGPRLTGLAKHVVFDSDNAMTGNPDGSREILRWSRPSFEKLEPPLTSYSAGTADESYENPAPALNGKYVAVESNANPTGGNADGNTEIFVFKPRSGEWLQVTDTVAPVENLRPATVDGRRILFDSTGDLHTDPKVTGIDNADGNRELFLARVKAGGVEVRQLTDTVTPAESHSGSLDSNSALVAFSSTGDLTGQNPDGSREIFTWHRRTGVLEQLTHATAGESTNPVVNLSQRFVVFESTADLTLSGATNRRIFQFDRVRGELLLLSRSRFGDNRTPRIRKRRYVVWESTSNLTGNNPTGERVIYLFDRKKD